MSDSENTTSGAPAKAPRSLSIDVLGLVAVVAGVFVLLAWAGMLVGAFLGFDQHAVRQASDFLLVVVLFAAVAALVARWKTGIVALVAALAYAAAWRYVGWGLTYAGDALFFSVAAAFYLTPVVVAVATIAAGRGRMRARKSAA